MYSYGNHLYLSQLTVLAMQQDLVFLGMTNLAMHNGTLSLVWISPLLRQAVACVCCLGDFKIACPHCSSLVQVSEQE